MKKKTAERFLLQRTHLKDSRMSTAKMEKSQSCLKCSDCTMTFVHESQLKCHATSHSDDVKYRCLLGLCKDRKGFKNLSDYNRYMETHKGDLIDCPEKGCSYQGKNRHQMMDHHRSQHSEPKPCKNKEKGCDFSMRDNRAMKCHLPTCDYADK